MAYPSIPFTLSKTLGTTLSNTTNPDPNTGLTYKSPYAAPTTENNMLNLRSQWTGQTVPGGGSFCPALFPIALKDGAGPLPLILAFEGTTSGATVAITVWQYNQKRDVWQAFESTYSSKTATDGNILVFDNLLNAPIYIQMAAPSAGTFSVDYNGDAFLAA